MAKPGRQAVFLDRDGTIIFDHGYLRAAQQVHLLAGAGEALAKIQAHGFALVLVSNQSGIGRGLITAQEADLVHQAFVMALADHGVRLDAAFYCPHAPEEACVCRKPSPEMLLRGARELGVDLSGSFLVGDKPSDIEAGKRAGCRTILLTGHAGAEHKTIRAEMRTALCPSESTPDMVACDWVEVLGHLLSSRRMIV